jgi:uncharacterized protein (DUF302 family)
MRLRSPFGAARRLFETRKRDLVPNVDARRFLLHKPEISMRLPTAIAFAAALIVSGPAAGQAPKATATTPAAATPTKPAKPPTDPNMVIRESKNSVKETLDKLAKAVEAKGAKVVARVDHAAGAKAVGQEMKPTEVLIFGNPKLGTPLMVGNVRSGLDLPLKVLAWEDGAGKVWVGYTKPSVLQSRYRLTAKDQAANFKAVSDALDGLTGAAIEK